MRDPVGPSERLSSERVTDLVWGLLASGRTTLLLAAALGLWWWLGATVPQGAGLPDLLRHHAFPVASAIAAFGLSEVVVSWPSELLLLLLAANLGARWLAARLAGTPVGSSASGVLATVGALSVLAGLGIDQLAGQRLRYRLIEGSATPATVVTREAGRWVPSVAGGALTCAPSDPQDARRRRACRFEPVPGAGPTEVILAAGSREPPLPWARLEAVAERPHPGSGAVLLCTGTAEQCASSGPRWSALPPGAAGERYRLPDGTELAAHFGRDGPLVVVAPPGQPPTLMAPALQGRPTPGPGERWLRGAPGWELEAETTEHTGVLLVWAGALLLAAGLSWLGIASLRAGPVRPARLRLGPYAGWFVGGLAATGGLLLAPEAVRWHDLVSAGCLGGALGCLARALFLEASRPISLAWAGLLVSMWLPEAAWPLEDADGRLLDWGLALQDTQTGARLGALGQAVVAAPSRFHELLWAARVILPLGWLASLADPGEPARRWLRAAGYAASVIAAGVAVGSALESLLGASLGEMPRPGLALELGHLSGGAGPVVAQRQAEPAFAAPGARLVIDAARALAALALAWCVWRAPAPREAGEAGGASTRGWLALALALCVLSVPFAAVPGAGLGAMTALWLGLAALVGRGPARAGLISCAAAAVLFAVLGPGLAWIPGG
jgi:hypothetical protein